MATYLEHNNITVSDLDDAIAFFTTVFSDWQLRYRGYLNEETQDTAWAHVGTEASYLALQAPPWGQPFSRQPSPYFDHLGIIVDDLDQVLEVLKRYPYRIRPIPETQGYKKIYVYIFDGIILEILEYKTTDWAIRNQYPE